jgi:hypothetical protein
MGHSPPENGFRTGGGAAMTAGVFPVRGRAKSEKGEQIIFRSEPRAAFVPRLPWAIIMSSLQDFSLACSARIVEERKGQRREPAAGDVEFVSTRTGWLRFTAPLGSRIVEVPGLNSISAKVSMTLSRAWPLSPCASRIAQ